MFLCETEDSLNSHFFFRKVEMFFRHEDYNEHTSTAEARGNLSTDQCLGDAKVQCYAMLPDGA